MNEKYYKMNDGTYVSSPSKNYTLEFNTQFYYDLQQFHYSSRGRKNNYEWSIEFMGGII